MKKKITFIAMAILCLAFSHVSEGQTVKYRGDVELAHGVSTHPESTSGIVKLQTTHGIMIKDACYLGLGLGYGYNYVTDAQYVPVVSLSSSYYFGDPSWKYRPFINARTGLQVGDEGTNSYALTVSGALGWGSHRFSTKIGYESEQAWIQTLSSRGKFSEERLTRGYFYLSLAIQFGKK